MSQNLWLWPVARFSRTPSCASGPLPMGRMINTKSKHSPHENAHLESSGGTVGPLACAMGCQRLARVVRQPIPPSAENWTARNNDYHDTDQECGLWDACARGPTVFYTQANVTGLEWTNCQGNATIIQYGISGEGYVWPQVPFNKPGGTALPTLSASALIGWLFQSILSLAYLGSVSFSTVTDRKRFCDKYGKQQVETEHWLHRHGSHGRCDGAQAARRRLPVDGV